jgi:hypothetical protein
MNLPSLLIFVIDHLLILFFKQKLIMIVKTSFNIKKKNHKPIIFLQLQKKRTINFKKLYKKLIIKKKYYISIQY